VAAAMVAVHLTLPNGTVFSYPELTSSPRLLDGNAAASYLGTACEEWLLFHGGGLFRLTTPFTGKTRLLPSFHSVVTSGSVSIWPSNGP